MKPSRKDILLEQIITEYIKTGVPVGSAFLAAKSEVKVSSATIRNEMAELERQGYLRQPHTSAGRVPTEKAYKLYLKSLHAKEPKESEKQAFDEIVRHLEQDPELLFKNIAKTLALFSGETVIWGFGDDEVHYTGIANLFGKPELQEKKEIKELSTAMDRLDDVMSKMFEGVSEEPTTYLGRENPFAKDCATVVVRMGDNEVMGILGLTRMDYEKNLGFINYLKEIL
jgi:heat-inducible transcriptional repressor